MVWTFTRPGSAHICIWPALVPKSASLLHSPTLPASFTSRWSYNGTAPSASTVLAVTLPADKCRMIVGRAAATAPPGGVAAQYMADVAPVLSAGIPLVDYFNFCDIGAAT